MPNSKKIYQANEEVIGQHLRSKEWVMYSGKLTIYDRKINPVVLSLKSDGNMISLSMDLWKRRKNLRGVLCQKYMENW